jgi:hypothetical protein
MTVTSSKVPAKIRVCWRDSAWGETPLPLVGLLPAVYLWSLPESTERMSTQAPVGRLVYHTRMHKQDTIGLKEDPKQQDRTSHILWTHHFPLPHRHPGRHLRRPQVLKTSHTLPLHRRRHPNSPATQSTRTEGEIIWDISAARPDPKSLKSSST